MLLISSSTWQCLTTPLDRKPLLPSNNREGSANIEWSYDVSSKINAARVKKAQGDLCLLAGAPIDAIARFQASFETAKSNEDIIWMGAACEGIACSLVLILLALVSIKRQFTSTHTKIDPINRWVNISTVLESVLSQARMKGVGSISSLAALNLPPIFINQLQQNMFSTPRSSSETSITTASPFRMLAVSIYASIVQKMREALSLYEECIPVHSPFLSRTGGKVPVGGSGGRTVVLFVQASVKLCRFLNVTCAKTMIMEISTKAIEMVIQNPSYSPFVQKSSLEMSRDSSPMRYDECIYREEIGIGGGVRTLSVLERITNTWEISSLYHLVKSFRKRQLLIESICLTGIQHSSFKLVSALARVLASEISSLITLESRLIEERYTKTHMINMIGENIAPLRSNTSRLEAVKTHDSESRRDSSQMRRIEFLSSPAMLSGPTTPTAVRSPLGCHLMSHKRGGGLMRWAAVLASKECENNESSQNNVLKVLWDVVKCSPKKKKTKKKIEDMNQLREIILIDESSEDVEEMDDEWIYDFLQRHITQCIVRPTAIGGSAWSSIQQEVINHMSTSEKDMSVSTRAHLMLLELRLLSRKASYQQQQAMLSQIQLLTSKKRGPPIRSPPTLLPTPMNAPSSSAFFAEASYGAYVVSDILQVGLPHFFYIKENSLFFDNIFYGQYGPDFPYIPTLTNISLRTSIDTISFDSENIKKNENNDEIPLFIQNSWKGCVGNDINISNKITWVVGEICYVEVRVRNPLLIQISLENVTLLTHGSATAEVYPRSLPLPGRNQLESVNQRSDPASEPLELTFVLSFKPLTSGYLAVTGIQYSFCNIIGSQHLLDMKRIKKIILCIDAIKDIQNTKNILFCDDSITQLVTKKLNNEDLFNLDSVLDLISFDVVNPLPTVNFQLKYLRPCLPASDLKSMSLTPTPSLKDIAQCLGRPNLLSRIDIPLIGLMTDSIEDMTPARDSNTTSSRFSNSFTDRRPFMHSGMSMGRDSSFNVTGVTQFSNQSQRIEGEQFWVGLSFNHVGGPRMFDVNIDINPLDDSSLESETGWKEHVVFARNQQENYPTYNWQGSKDISQSQYSSYGIYTSTVSKCFHFVDDFPTEDPPVSIDNSLLSKPKLTFNWVSDSNNIQHIDKCVWIHVIATRDCPGCNINIMVRNHDMGTETSKVYRSIRVPLILSVSSGVAVLSSNSSSLLPNLIVTPNISLDILRLKQSIKKCYGYSKYINKICNNIDNYNSNNIFFNHKECILHLPLANHSLNNFELLISSQNDTIKVQNFIINDNEIIKIWPLIINSFNQKNIGDLQLQWRMTTTDEARYGSVTLPIKETLQYIIKNESALDPYDIDFDWIVEDITNDRLVDGPVYEVDVHTHIRLKIDIIIPLKKCVKCDNYIMNDIIVIIVPYNTDEYYEDIIYDIDNSDSELSSNDEYIINEIELDNILIESDTDNKLIESDKDNKLIESDTDNKWIELGNNWTSCLWTDKLISDENPSKIMNRRSPRIKKRSQSCVNINCNIKDKKKQDIPYKILFEGSMEIPAIYNKDMNKSSIKLDGLTCQTGAQVIAIGIWIKSKCQCSESCKLVWNHQPINFCIIDFQNHFF
eukprot:GHVL01016897.1.p1 GENE.GHVL01016897.1~~GHVL01016897.1.p1  ORF type:complete len:1772 (+),score=397.21 GHVL01016897.1:527-5317(+)